MQKNNIYIYIYIYKEELSEYQKKRRKEKRIIKILIYILENEIKNRKYWEKKKQSIEYVKSRKYERRME